MPSIYSSTSTEPSQCVRGGPISLMVSRWRIWVGLICMVATTSCMKPGGGGCIHIPPAVVRRGVPTTLELELSAVYSSGPMDRRIGVVRCYYRLSGEAAYTATTMKVISFDDRTLVVRGTIPALSWSSSGLLEYYFDFRFDGHPNTRGSEAAPEARVPIE